MRFLEARPPHYTPYPNPDLPSFILDGSGPPAAGEDKEDTSALPPSGESSPGRPGLLAPLTPDPGKRGGPGVGPAEAHPPEDNEALEVPCIRAKRSGPVYNAHSYHTKLPPQAVLPLIKRFTRPGELVLDPFCGSGMVGVAALQAQRRALLIDLSPAATFIASNYLFPPRQDEFEEAVESFLGEAEQLCGWAYKTCLPSGPATVDYLIWSDVVCCPDCGREVVLWDAAVDLQKGRVSRQISCPHCERGFIGREQPVVSSVPVLLACRPHHGPDGSPAKQVRIRPRPLDLALVSYFKERKPPAWYPNLPLPPGRTCAQPRHSHGIERVDQFYTPRNLYVLSLLWQLACTWPRAELRPALMFLVSSYNLTHSTRMSRVIFKNGSRPVLTGNQPGTLYVSSFAVEKNILRGLRRKAKAISKALASLADGRQSCRISTQSATDLSNIPDASIDYIITDPPFGGNIRYSEVNFIWEAWLGVRTDRKQEAIIDDEAKDLRAYAELMQGFFSEAFRVLRPGRCLTLVFHNSQADVWNALRTAMESAGFSLESSMTLDKEQRSFKQANSKGAVRHDLLICARKPARAGPVSPASGPPAGGDADGASRAPAASGAKGITQGAGTEDSPPSEWPFELRWVYCELKRLPVKQMEARTQQMLYSRAVAACLREGRRVRMDAASFYRALEENFENQEGYWYIRSQLL